MFLEEPAVICGGKVWGWGGRGSSQGKFSQNLRAFYQQLCGHEVRDG